jgi:hypothetical protein
MTLYLRETDKSTLIDMSNVAAGRVQRKNNSFPKVVYSAY